MNTDEFFYSTFRTAWGWVGLTGSEREVAALVLPKASKAAAAGRIRASHPSAVEDRRRFRRAQDEIIRYFRGERITFSNGFDLSTLSPLTQAVLEATFRIPYGKVRTYREIASAIGHPKAARAVGNALGANPLPILIPCHRVIRSDGGLGGYSAKEGPALKQKLLRLELQNLLQF